MHSHTAEAYTSVSYRLVHITKNDRMGKTTTLSLKRTWLCINHQWCQLYHSSKNVMPYISSAIGRSTNTIPRSLSFTKRSTHLHSTGLNWFWNVYNPTTGRKTDQIRRSPVESRRKSGQTEFLVWPLLQPTSYKLHLRSTSSGRLFVPRSKTAAGNRSSAVAGPRLWNSLPTSITSAGSLAIFKKQLKTFLFRTAYDWHVLLTM